MRGKVIEWGQKALFGHGYSQNTANYSNRLPSVSDLFNRSVFFYIKNFRSYSFLAVIFVMMSATPAVILTAALTKRASLNVGWRDDLIYLLYAGAIVLAMNLLMAGVAFFAHTISTNRLINGQANDLLTVMQITLVRLKSLMWIATLQVGAAAGLIYLPVLFGMLINSRAMALAGGMVGLVGALALATSVALAGFIHLDDGRKGLAALAASRSLVEQNAGGVAWRVIAFFTLGAFVQAIPTVGVFMTGFLMIPLTAIFLSFLYNDLKEMPARQTAPAANLRPAR